MMHGGRSSAPGGISARPDRQARRRCGPVVGRTGSDGAPSGLRPCARSAQDPIRSRFRSTWRPSSRVSLLPVRRWRAGSIVEMGTPLLKNQGIANVVPAFHWKFPRSAPVGRQKTMDGAA